MEKRAREFVAKLRAHGHRPNVHNGHLGIELSVSEPTAPPEPYHSGGASHTLGFDTEPYFALVQSPEGIATLVEALKAESSDV
jgi:hypothetical protein